MAKYDELDAQYIRNQYKVPVKEDAPVIYLHKQGRVVGTKGMYIIIHFDDEAAPHPAPFHPTWQMHWLEEATA